MNQRIRRAAVLGAGVMGSGIAAHLANAGIPTLLLDLVTPTASLDLLRKQKPAPLFSAAAIDSIEVGSFDKDLPKIAQCQWVIEVIKEDLSLKQNLFAQVEQYLAPGAIVSSNTSGLSIKGMLKGRGQAFRRQFLVTHFFNPVRYMQLLELIAGDETDPEVLLRMSQFGEEVLGKGIVYGRDSTNFIANRIGVYTMMRTIAEMQRAELPIEAVDKILGPAMGRPKSAVFRTADIVGLDTFLHVATNCYDTLADDEAREAFKIPEFMSEMVKKGMLGDKSGQGFYKKLKGPGGEKEILALDLASLTYRPQQKIRYPSLGEAKDIENAPARIVVMMNSADAAGRFAELLTLDVLAYASRRIPEISDDLVNIDRGMRWGFGWELGPFEIWDAYGVRKGVSRMKELGFEPAPWVAQMLSSGRESFYRDEGPDSTFWGIGSQHAQVVPQNSRVIRVDAMARRGNQKIEGNDSASVWDLGDGITLLEYHSKMNSIDDQIIAMTHRAIEITERDFIGMVVGNDGKNFSAGANIMALLMAIKSDDFATVRSMASTFQQANQRLHYSAIPVVTAPFNLTLGGGAEAALAGNAIQASAELYMGLVEVGVGLIPGGGGNMMLMRQVYGPFAHDKDFDPFPFLKKLFLQIGTAQVSTSAEGARLAGFLVASDGISLNRDLVLSDAKARAVGMANSGFRPPRPTSFRLPGRSGQATIDMQLYDMQLQRQISEYDRKIGQKLASVLSGGDTAANALVTEDRLLELELEAFLSLCGEEKTQDRLAHMLTTGKPLRN